MSFIKNFDEKKFMNGFYLSCSHRNKIANVGKTNMQSFLVY